jgi:hypothetical protein
MISRSATNGFQAYSTPAATCAARPPPAASPCRSADRRRSRAAPAEASTKIASSTAFWTTSAGAILASAAITASLGTARGSVPPVPSTALLNCGRGTKTMS